MSQAVPPPAPAAPPARGRSPAAAKTPKAASAAAQPLTPPSSTPPRQVQEPQAPQQQEQQAAPLWQFVPLADYKPPTLPVSSAAAQSWAAVKQLLRRHDDAHLVPARQEQALRALSDLRLAHLVRPIDWAEASRALDQGAGHSPGLRFVVGQPHAGHAEIVEAWAQRHQARLITPPTTDQILADDPLWPLPGPSTPETEPELFSARFNAGAPAAQAEPLQAWALPRLEHCFLRHADGLALVRRLLAHVASGRAGPGLIGCDSWAWAYLQLVWPLPQPEALTLQAADAEHLRRLFVHLAPPRRRRPLRFRNARTGSETMTVPPSENAPSDDLVLLAAHCRGNVGTARAYWRWRLRAEPDVDADTEATEPDAPSEAAAAPAQTVAAQEVWVSAALGEPQLPADAGEDISLLLHALLLHGGLPETQLPLVLPLPAHQVLALLLRLQRVGLVVLQAERWQVSPLAYTMVRAWLRGRDFLTDAF